MMLPHESDDYAIYSRPDYVPPISWRERIAMALTIAALFILFSGIAIWGHR